MTLRRLALLAAVPFTLSVSFAQEKPKEEPKKEQPKKLERIAVADPKDVKDDADFATQGEYVSDPKAKYKMAYQVVARGGGKFDIALYEGGLPGEEGSKLVSLKDHTAVLKDGVAEVFYPVFGKVQKIGQIKDGKITIDADPAQVYTKTERKSPTLGAEPPKGAVVLFGKEGDEKNWAGGKLVELSDGKFLNNGITTKAELKTPYALHVEFRLPWMPNSTGQQRGNSGVYLQDRFELQVLDSFGLKGENNECGGFYTLHKPKVNACLPPLVWQTYDIEFTPAVVEGKKVTKPAKATVKHNGVLIQDGVELPRRTDGGEERGNPWAIQFQNHGDLVIYRNVWVVEKK